MSGGGGGGYVRRNIITPRASNIKLDDIQSSGGLNDPCDIKEQTILHSPNVSNLSGIRKGIVLNVSLRQGSKIVALDSSSKLVGTIICPSNSRIINCINNGNQYVAEVIFKRGAQIRVQIRRK